MCGAAEKRGFEKGRQTNGAAAVARGSEAAADLTCPQPRAAAQGSPVGSSRGEKKCNNACDSSTNAALTGPPPPLHLSILATQQDPSLWASSCCSFTLACRLPSQSEQCNCIFRLIKQQLLPPHPHPPSPFRLLYPFTLWRRRKIKTWSKC